MSERRATDRELIAHELETMTALRLVEEERYRQDRLKAEGRFPFTLADPMPEPFKLACILEECGEVARNLLARVELVSDGDPSEAALRRELVQIAALSVAWIESLL